MIITSSPPVEETHMLPTDAGEIKLLVRSGRIEAKVEANFVLCGGAPRFAHACRELVGNCITWRNCRGSTPRGSLNSPMLRPSGWHRSHCRLGERGKRGSCFS